LAKRLTLYIVIGMIAGILVGYALNRAWPPAIPRSPSMPIC
jgi:Na+/H+-dicarboxylate symporter